MKATPKAAKKKAPPGPRKLTLDERLVRLLKQTEASARRSEADRDRLVRLEKVADKERKAADKERAAADRRTKAADRRAEAAREAADRRAEAAREAADHRAKAAYEAADRRAKAADRRAEAAREAADRRAEAASAAADRRAKAAYEAIVRQAEEDALRADADRDRLARLENAVDKDRRNNENHRRNSSRALEDAFAVSLPRVMRRAFRIRIKPEDVRVRARKGRKRREYDFVAPNSKLVLVGEVKTRFTAEDLNQLRLALFQFRRDFPEYAGLKLHGVVAGGTVEKEALDEALEDGFIVLQMDGAEAHPASGKGFRPTAY